MQESTILIFFQVKCLYVTIRTVTSQGCPSFPIFFFLINVFMLQLSYNILQGTLLKAYVWFALQVEKT